MFRYTERFQELTLICTKFIANETEKVEKYISGLPDNIYGNVKSARPKTLDETIELANDLMDQKLCTYAERQSDNKKRLMIHPETTMVTSNNPSRGRISPRSTGNTNIANTQKGNGATPKGNGCFECGTLGHFKRDCPKMKNKDGGNRNAQGWVYAVGNAEKRGNAPGNPDANVATAVMSSTSLAFTYTSVYTNSEPGRAFWGADDEEISKGGIPRAHDPDYVPEPIYLEYIPLEDEHEFPAEEQPLPPVDSPTAESPGYVTESYPEKDPEEYEDGPVDYPMDGGDDGDDDDGDSSRDDANDEDEDDKDKEEEEHIAPADYTIIVPVDEPVFPPEGIEPVIPPPSTDIIIGARISVRPQTSISLPPEAKVERLLAMTTLSPSLPISLSPPSAGDRLDRITSTQALIDAVTAALPLPPSLYIPPPVDHRDEIPESEQPPRRGIDYGFVSTIDAEERRQGIRDVGYGIRDTWVDPTEAVPEIAPMAVGEDAQDRDNMDGGGGGLCFPRGLGSLDRIESGDSSRALDPSDMWQEMSDMQAELLSLREQQRRARQPRPEARIPDHQDASGDADSHI
ncbi:reverse transcriptase domain-containing protein [Tanacetum coccineum]